jgi:isorenieratene synthase
MAQLQDLASLQNLSRRTVLKLFGVGTIATGVGYSRFSKPQPAVHNRDTVDLPYQPSRNLKAVVIGGGLAGLAAAYELSQRGVAGDTARAIAPTGRQNCQLAHSGGR